MNAHEYKQNKDAFTRCGYYCEKTMIVFYTLIQIV
jgi:hypothetical protein